MATSTDFPFVLSLSLSLFLFCSRISPTSSTDVPISVSAKAAAVQHWNRVVGSNSGPPSVLLAHVANTSPLDLIASLNEAGVAFGDFKSDDDIRMVTGEDAKKLGDEHASSDPRPSSRSGHSQADKHAISFSPDATSMYGHSQADKHAISFSPDATSMYGHGRAVDADMRRVAGGSDDKHAISFSPDVTSMYGHSRAVDADMRRAAGGSDDKHAISFSPDVTSMYGHSRASDAQKAAGGDAKENSLYVYERSSDDKHASSFSPDATSMYGHSRAADADTRKAAGGDAKENSLHASSSDSTDQSSMAGRNSANKQKQSMAHDGDHGVFFRESQLKKGTTMPTADFGGERPHQDFLPRNIASRIPLSADAVMKLFRVPADSSMGNAVITTVELCKEAPLKGETRRCVTSAEDMIDYVVSSLGAKPNANITARSTIDSNGMGSGVLVGGVKAVNGGKLGRVVSCHQASFPYLLYQCHSVPETRLYEVEILDPETGEMMNLATAICHFDTSRWSPGFAAFIALGSERGTEVCHWIYPRNIAWIVAAE